MPLLSFILLAPDTYVYITWGVLLVLSLALKLLWRHCRRWLRRTLLVLLICCWHVFLWGTYVGFGRLEVVHIEYASADLPPAFDGYRIVHFSDAHVGTYSGRRQQILRRAVDSINAQHADLVVFTGDLQNCEPQGVLQHQALLATIKGRDGVCSVLGNHDYPMYIQASEYTKRLNRSLIETYQREMGWRVLTNNHITISRDSAHIVIAGMENDGTGRFPQLGNVVNALHGVTPRDFVVMLEHDPTAWRRKILPECHAQLTLSGHSHGGQFSLFGLTPAAFLYREHTGMYRSGQRALYVSRGLGGVVPFRFGATPEITVITLRSK